MLLRAVYGACQRLIPVLPPYDVCVQVVLSRTAHSDVRGVTDARYTTSNSLDDTLPVGGALPTRVLMRRIFCYIIDTVDQRLPRLISILLEMTGRTLCVLTIRLVISTARSVDPPTLCNLRIPDLRP